MASARRDVLPLVSASAFYGSRDATELSAAVTPNLDDGFLSLSGRWDRGDGFWTTPADQRGPASVRSAYDNWRSEEHTSELQSLMRISYAVFCLKKKNNSQKETLEYRRLQ